MTTYTAKDVEELYEDSSLRMIDEHEIIKWIKDGLIIPSGEDGRFTELDVYKLGVIDRLLQYGNVHPDIITKIVNNSLDELVLIGIEEKYSVWDVLQSEDNCELCRYYFTVTYYNMISKDEESAIGFGRSIPEILDYFNIDNDQDGYLECLKIVDVVTTFQELEIKTLDDDFCRICNGKLIYSVKGDRRECIDCHNVEMIEDTDIICHECNSSILKLIDEIQGRQTFHTLECPNCGFDMWIWDSGDTLTDTFIDLVKEHPETYLEFAKTYEPNIENVLEDE